MVTVEVCIGSACYVKGSYNIISDLQDMVGEAGLQDEVTVKAAFCHGECARAVAVKFTGEDEIYSVSPKTARAFFENEIKKRVG